MSHFISTLNPITLQIFLSNYLYQSKLDYLKNILNQSGYGYKLQYKPPNNENKNKSKSPKNRKRNIIWFNPPFSKNVSNNIGKYFILLIRKHFPNNHKYDKILNKNNVKISYSFTANIESIISMHNKEVITEKKTQAVNCNCVIKPDFPLSNQCQITNIIYKAKITSNLRNYHGKITYGTSEDTFKQRYGNHKKLFNHKKHNTDTELSKEYWRLKELKAQPQVQFYILKRCQPRKRTGICYLCLNEKLFIIEYQGNDLLNQKNEFISKCRHKNKFKLINHKT